VCGCSAVCTGPSHQPGCRSLEAAEAVAAAAAAELLAEEEHLKEQRRGQQHAGAAAGQARRQQRHAPAGPRKAVGAPLQRQPAASAAAEAVETRAAPGDAGAGGQAEQGGEGTADSAGHAHADPAPVQSCPADATASCPADQPTTPGLGAAQQGLPSRASADKCSPQLPPVPAQQPVKAEAQAAGLDEGLLADLLCPITQELMEDPVVAADGETYERAAIQGGCRACGRPWLQGRLH
jgi:hypothetical protein